MFQSQSPYFVCHSKTKKNGREELRFSRTLFSVLYFSSQLFSFASNVCYFFFGVIGVLHTRQTQKNTIKTPKTKTERQNVFFFVFVSATLSSLSPPLPLVRRVLRYVPALMSTVASGARRHPQLRHKDTVRAIVRIARSSTGNARCGAVARGRHPGEGVRRVHSGRGLHGAQGAYARQRRRRRGRVCRRRGAARGHGATYVGRHVVRRRAVVEVDGVDLRELVTAGDATVVNCNAAGGAGRGARQRRHTATLLCVGASLVREDVAREKVQRAVVALGLERRGELQHALPALGQRRGPAAAAVERGGDVRITAGAVVEVVQR
eukprot:PhM_4_TR10084/c1_g1_i1/m.75557